MEKWWVEKSGTTTPPPPPVSRGYHIVIFNENGGTHVDAQLVVSESKLAKVDISRAHHMFTGWFLNLNRTGDTWDFENDRVARDLILYAGWVPSQYTVSFDAKGGFEFGSTTEPANPLPQEILYGNKVKEPLPMSKGNEAFAGWYTKDGIVPTGDWGEQWDFTWAVPENNMTLFAKWMPAEYEIYFNLHISASGGNHSVTPPMQPIAEGGKIITPPTPFWDGYIFGGWYIDSWTFKDIFYSVEWDFSTPVTSVTTADWDTSYSGNYDLHAKWVSTPYSVTFITNDGTPIPPAQAVMDGARAQEPAPITRDGYAFSGWFSNAGLTTLYDFDAAVRSNLILYAKWDTAHYTVTFDPNGGSPAPAAQRVGIGAKAQKPLPINLAGFGFVGWFREDLNREWNFNDPVTQNMTLTARWDTNFYTVEFKSNGGTPQPSDQVVAFNSQVTRPANMTRLGHEFGGWFSEETFINPWAFTTPVTSNLTLHARWIRKDYVVTFFPDEGMPAPSPLTQRYLYDTLVTRPAPMTRTGHTFVGWFTSPSGTQESSWDFSTNKVLGDTALYAKWVKLPVFWTVTFEADGGTVVDELLGPPPQIVSDGTRAAEPPLMAKSGGFGFGGWYLAPGDPWGEAWVFARERVYSNLTLYARWEAITSRVIFAPGFGTPAPKEQIIARGTKVQEPGAMTREGFSFGGWYATSNLTGILGNPWNFSTGIVTTPELILHALWIPNDIPPTELIQRVRIHGVYYVDFAGNSITYNGPPVPPGGKTPLTAEQLAGNDAALDNVAKVMRDHPDFIVQLSGHANPVDNTEEELAELIQLSTDRSDAVLQEFIKKGIPAGSMINAGYNDRLYGDGSHGSLNRTVEIIIVEYLPLAP